MAPCPPAPPAPPTEWYKGIHPKLEILPAEGLPPPPPPAHNLSRIGAGPVGLDPPTLHKLEQPAFFTKVAPPQLQPASFLARVGLQSPSRVGATGNSGRDSENSLGLASGKGAAIANLGLSWGPLIWSPHRQPIVHCFFRHSPGQPFRKLTWSAPSPAHITAQKAHSALFLLALSKRALQKADMGCPFRKLAIQGP